MKFTTASAIAAFTTFSGVQGKPLLGGLLGGGLGGGIGGSLLNGNTGNVANTVTGVVSDPLGALGPVLFPLQSTLEGLAGQITSTAGGATAGSALNQATLRSLQIQVNQVVDTLSQTTTQIITIAQQSTNQATGQVGGGDDDDETGGVTGGNLATSTLGSLNQITNILNALSALNNIRNQVAINRLISQLTGGTGGLLNGLGQVPGASSFLQQVISQFGQGQGVGGGLVGGLLGTVGNLLSSLGLGL